MSRERRLTLPLAFVFALLLSATPVQAGEPTPLPPSQSPLVFVLDPKLGMEAGVRTFDSLGRVIFRYDEALPALATFDETRMPGKIGAIAGRFAQWLFVDTAIAAFDATLIHEVFGHGARARDLRQEAKFDFALPGIYCVLLGDGENCTSHAQVTGGPGSRDRSILVTSGGVEANLLTGFWIETRMVQTRGWLHQGDLLLYGASKLAYSDSFLSRKVDTALTLSESNDVANYVTGLQDRFNLPTADDRRRVSRQLRTAYVWNLMDPLLWYAAYASFYRGIVRGERWSRAPVPTVGEYTLYAAPRFGVTPFGPEHYVDVLVGRDSSVVGLYGRVGSSGLASYTGAGVRAIGVRLDDRLALGGEIDVWSQPQTLLDDRAVYDRPQRRGVNAGLTADVRLFQNVGLTGRLAYKTAGFLAGQPIGEGLYGYFGATIAFDRPR